MSTDMPVRACLRSGMCCTIAPCPFGEWDAEKHQCAFLEIGEVKGEAVFHRCGKFAEISSLPPEHMANFSPAFGSGCCSPMGNKQRQQNRAFMAERDGVDPDDGYIEAREAWISSQISQKA